MNGLRMAAIAGTKSAAFSWMLMALMLLSACVRCRPSRVVPRIEPSVSLRATRAADGVAESEARHRLEETKVDVVFEETPLLSALSFLEQAAAVQIRCDPMTVQDAQEIRTSLRLERQSVWCVLYVISKVHGLRLRVKGCRAELTRSPVESWELTTVHYDVSQVTVEVFDTPPGLQCSADPSSNGVRRVVADGIRRFIIEASVPGTWLASGCSIEYSKGYLTVRHTQEIHSVIRTIVSIAQCARERSNRVPPGFPQRIGDRPCSGLPGDRLSPCTFREAPLPGVVSALSAAAGVKLKVDSASIPDAATLLVTLDADALSLIDALDQICANCGLETYWRDSQIIIRRTP